jgi:hypothetical protein
MISSFQRTLPLRDATLIFSKCGLLASSIGWAGDCQLCSLPGEIPNCSKWVGVRSPVGSQGHFLAALEL